MSAGCRNDLMKAMEAVKRDRELQGRGGRVVDVFVGDDVIVFMDEVGLTGGSWVSLWEGTYRVVEGDSRRTTASLEVEVAASALVCDGSAQRQSGDDHSLKGNASRGHLPAGWACVGGAESAAMYLVSVAAVEVSKGGPIQQVLDPSRVHARPLPGSTS